MNINDYSPKEQDATIAPSDFLPGNQKEAMAISEIALNSHYMIEQSKYVTEYHRAKLNKLIGEILEITGERRGELLSVAYTSRNHKRVFKCLGF